MANSKPERLCLVIFTNGAGDFPVVKNEEYRLLVRDIQRSIRPLLAGDYKTIWLFDVVNGKLNDKNGDYSESSFSILVSSYVKLAQTVKYVLRFFILKFIFGRRQRHHYKAYIGYFVDVDDQGISNHLRSENTSDYDIFYWYISSANSLKDLVIGKMNGRFPSIRLLENYCSSFSFIKNFFHAFFLFYAIPSKYRIYSSYITIFDILNKINSLEAFISMEYTNVKYLSEQYVWEDILTCLGKSALDTEAVCHNLAGPDDLKLNNLLCFMTEADRYLIKYSIHQAMLREVGLDAQLANAIPMEPLSSSVARETTGFMVYGSFSPESNRVAIDIANTLARNHVVFFKPHPSGGIDCLSSNVTVTRTTNDCSNLVNICFYPTKMIDYCCETALPTLVCYNNRNDDTSKFLEMCQIPFATYADIKTGEFTKYIDFDGRSLRGIYAN